MATEFLQRLESVQSRIGRACEKAGRSSDTVKLVLVSKTFSAEYLRLALDQGSYCLGENKAQELKPKATALSDLDLTWHFIGHLQSNKIKDVLPFISLLHSLDSRSLAQKLQNKLASLEQHLAVLIQVNTSEEKTKSGVDPDDCPALIEHVMNMPNLRLQGLMTIAENSEQEEPVRACFRRLAQLRQNAISAGVPALSLRDLSMGMSQDFEWAIEEGATLIRLGSAVFGERNYSA